jgi:phospholipid/cholesterol/gamma-HCH transport system substrate-binding protein
VKIANELKVGILAVIVITLLIFGYNFLKGNELFQSKTRLYARYENVQGLTKSNPIFLNGMQIGSVQDVRFEKDLRHLLVELSVQSDVTIPVNSIAVIIPNPLGTPKMEIRLGDASTFLKANDTILTNASKGIIDDVLSKVDPLLFEVKGAVTSLDSVLENVNSVLDIKNKQHIESTLDYFNQIAASLLHTSAALDRMLADQSSLNKTLQNAEAFTAGLDRKDAKIDDVLANLSVATQKIKDLNVNKTLSVLDSATQSLHQTLNSINTKSGTVGLLLNDSTLYYNMKASVNKLNTLLDDVRMHPKRYVSISVFGRKKQTAPLISPLPDTLDAPYLLQKSRP